MLSGGEGDPRQMTDLTREEAFRDKSEFVGSEEVGGGQYVQMDPDELLPGRSLPADGRRSEIVALENISNRLIAELNPEVGQGSLDAVMTSGAILAVKLRQ